jgi:hypothetical protein
MLDLDHARPEVRQEHRAERAGEHPREIQDENAVERSSHRPAYRGAAAGRHPNGPGRKWKSPTGEISIPSSRFERPQY